MTGVESSHTREVGEYGGVILPIFVHLEALEQAR